MSRCNSSCQAGFPALVKATPGLDEAVLVAQLPHQPLNLPGVQLNDSWAAVATGVTPPLVLDKTVLLVPAG